MTLSELLTHSIQTIGTSSETPALDARLIINHILGTSEASFILHKNDEVSEEGRKRILKLIQEHRDGKPVAYITGKRAFWRDDFATRPGVLIPQPDTETLVQGALDCAGQQKDSISILDLCSGTGCVGISIAKELSKICNYIDLTLSDIDPAAFECSKANAKALITDIGIKNIAAKTTLGDLYNPVQNNTFDLIVSNPPYIQTEVAKTLGPEVKAQGMLALDGGKDGLDLIRRIVCGAMAHKSGSLWLLIEIGYDEGHQVKELFEASGFENVEILKDLGGRNRVVKGLLK